MQMDLIRLSSTNAPRGLLSECSTPRTLLRLTSRSLRCDEMREDRAGDSKGIRTPGVGHSVWTSRSSMLTAQTPPGYCSIFLVLMPLMVWAQDRSSRGSETEAGQVEFLSCQRCDMRKE